MVSNKTVYLTYYIILYLMGYTDSGNISEEQIKCLQGLRDDFNYTDGPLTSNKLTLPRIAFKEKAYNQFKTIQGFNYFQKIIEKAATGTTDSPRKFCDGAGFILCSPSLCMEQLHEVYQFTDENNALPIIKWTYARKRESDIPKTFDATHGNKILKLEHFALTYFNHMYDNLDVFVSIPWPTRFCQSEKPSSRQRNQSYRQHVDGNSAESSQGKMTVREQHRAYGKAYEIQKKNKLNTDGNPGESSGGEVAVKELRKDNKRPKKNSVSNT